MRQRGFKPGSELAHRHLPRRGLTWFNLLMFTLLVVGAGGFLGSIARYVTGGAVHGFFPGSLFPLGTLTVNTLGCFAIGVLAYLVEERGSLGVEWRAFLMVGVLGGFTTFSAFGYETLNLLRDGEFYLAVANVALNLGIGLLSVLSGNALAHLVWR